MLDLGLLGSGSIKLVLRDGMCVGDRQVVLFFFHYFQNGGGGAVEGI